MNPNKYLEKLCFKSLKNKKLDKNKKYIERLNNELHIIKVLNFSEYFLIVADLCHWAKKNNILTGPGRGSAAASMVSYCLGITKLDPLKYDLLFSRFLNAGRGGTPAINFKEDPIENIVSYNDFNISLLEKARNLEIKDRIKECPFYENELMRTILIPELNKYVNYILHKNLKVDNECGSAIAYVCGLSDTLPTTPIKIIGGSAPDIDLDVPRNSRQDIINYLISKYGENKTSVIINYVFTKSKQAIRDAGRILEIDYATVDKISRTFPENCKTIKQAIEEDERFAKIAEKYKDLIKAAIGLEGSINSSSIHAAGVLITPDDMTNYLPVNSVAEKKGPRRPVAAWDKNIIDSIGLLKMDILGIKNLDIIVKTIEEIVKNYPDIEDIDPYSIPLDDQKVFNLLQEGKTIGVFQLNGTGMTSFLKKLVPKTIDDLSLANALFRPGPLESGMTEEYLAVKNMVKEANHYPEAIEKIVSETNGVFVYQEQVMRMFTDAADYTMEEADIIRKAMGKKKIDIMEHEKKRFIKKAFIHNIDNDVAEKLFNNVAKFAEYGFNKSHSYSYAMLGYVTAWFKVNYPLEFHAALLDMTDNYEELSKTIATIQHEDIIKVLPPDIKLSKTYTSVDYKKNAIRLGINLIKNVSNYAARDLINIIQKRKIVTIEDVIIAAQNSKIRVNDLIFMIKAGALDSLIKSRKGVVDCLEDKAFMAKLKNKANAKLKIEERTQKLLILWNNKIGTFENAYKDKINDMTSTEIKRKKKAFEKKKKEFKEKFKTFESFVNEDTFIKRYKENANFKLEFESTEEYSEVQRSIDEYKAFGLFITTHPLNQYKKLFLGLHGAYYDDIFNVEKDKYLKLLAIPVSFKTKTSNSGNIYGICNLIIFGGTIDMLVWKNKIKEVEDLIESESPIVLTVKTMGLKDKRGISYIDGILAKDIKDYKPKPSMAFDYDTIDNINMNNIISLPFDNNGVPLQLAINFNDNVLLVALNKKVATTSNNKKLRFYY